MKIEAIDFLYLSMPVVKNIGDGSQDCLLVRVRGGGFTGWGECEASPLVCIANLVCPMSHSACRSPQEAVLGQTADSPGDIAAINRRVREFGLDIAQTGHTLSGIDIALWDLLGKRYEQPVYQLLGFPKTYPKRPYASQLFGDNPQETFEKGRAMGQAGYSAVKFGWGPFGRDLHADRDHLMAARKGVGEDVELLIDAGTVWGEAVEPAAARLEMLRDIRAGWLEEPFVGSAVHAYRALAGRNGGIPLAGGEGASHPHQARQLIDDGGIGIVQIDTGRIGGITPAKEIADYARAKGVRYVNHTFTTHLALSASLQPFAGMAGDDLCEYPVEASELAQELTLQKLLPDGGGLIHLSDAPGLGVCPDPQAIEKYRVDVEIRVAGRTLYSTPNVAAD
jgi:L-alanine-DL-glutamate epimerase-like enolase superfamily enzyme